MRFKLLAALAVALPSLIAAAQTAPAPTPPNIAVERNVAMKTRDGVTLRADVFRPTAEGSYPVLLVRTPYDKTGFTNFGLTAAARGYIVVAQDTRGRYGSEGEWYTFKNEPNDGYDTVEWAAALPHSDGRVGMFSGSYVGATQMLAAIASPPHLAGICPIVTASNYHENWTYQGGAFEQWFNQSWTSGLAQDTANRLIKAHTNALTGIETLPLGDYPLFDLHNFPTAARLTGALAPYYQDWLAHPVYDDYWKQWSIEENFQKIKVPALVIGAWYDIFLGGSLRNYEGIRDHGGTPEARQKTQLLVAIGGHSGWGRTVGKIDFGPDAPFDENLAILDWYDFLFKGIQNRFASDKPVKIFVMGENKWREEAAWPLARAKQTRYLLGSAGYANTAAGDGVLVAAGGSSAVSDTFVYDPANPVPTVGGPLCCDGTHEPAGPRKQNEVEARQDVLVYSTAALEADTEVTGPVKLDLWATTSAADTDFTAKLVDVAPDGTAYNVTEGILRARYRNSTTKAEPVEAGKPVEYTIDLWSTATVFLKGHRIRLEVSSSNFPRFDRNPNTGKTFANSTEYVKATNTVLHDKAHPSALILPIVKR
ncbi:MAG: CocE/NonD family hydrolase [Terracidiphilus sp.]|nr:CocE/NonD family hydrolase [Terracidiphilus sp.]